MWRMKRHIAIIISCLLAVTLVFALGFWAGRHCHSSAPTAKPDDPFAKFR